MYIKNVNKILVLFFVLIFCVSTVSAADNSSIICQETNIDDSYSTLSLDMNENNIKSGNVGSLSDLKQLIESSEGSINLDKDYSFDESVDSLDSIKINKNITINGNDHVINILNKTRLFYINSSSVSIKNLNVINANNNNSSGFGVITISKSNVNI